MISPKRLKFSPLTGEDAQKVYCVDKFRSKDTMSLDYSSICNIGLQDRMGVVALTFSVLIVNPRISKFVYLAIVKKTLNASRPSELVVEPLPVVYVVHGLSILQ